MASIVLDTDILIGLYESVLTRKVGTESPYYKDSNINGIVHPGTNKNILGWEWNVRTWPTEVEVEATNYIPTLWNSATSPLTESYFQSGYGDRDDLVLIDIENYFPSGLPVKWAPLINSGYYYRYDQEFFLYSDWFKAELVPASQTVSGMQYLDLSYIPKNSAPVKVRQFQYNYNLGRYDIEREFDKVLDFTASGTDPEYKIDYSVTPARLYLNSGSWNTSFSLETVGISSGVGWQEYRTSHSPIDPEETLEVWSVSSSGVSQQWTIVSGINQFVSSGMDVYLNQNSGVLSFGNYSVAEGTGTGLIPSQGDLIKVTYTTSTEVAYEPDSFSEDYITALTADVNPLASVKDVGFVQVANIGAPEPSSIVLTASGITLLSSDLYEMEMGNNIAEFVGTVSSEDGSKIEGLEVIFELLGPVTGGFAGDTAITNGITDFKGQAKTFYNAPTSIEDTDTSIKNFSIVYSYRAPLGQTIIDIDGINPDTSLSKIYIYAISSTDNILGIPEGSYYDTTLSGYLASGLVLSGVTATNEWEEDWRLRNDLPNYLTYQYPLLDSEKTVGKKTIVLTTRHAVSTISGDYEIVLAPVNPISLTDIGTKESPGARITFNTALTTPSDPTFAGPNTTKGYMVMSDMRIAARAYIINNRTQERIYSNIVNVNVNIPDTWNGTYYADTLNDLPSGLILAAKDVGDPLQVTEAYMTSVSGTLDREYQTEKLLLSGIEETYFDWFKRTQRGSSTVLGLLTITPSGTLGAEVPLGFRIKSDELDMASVLDAVTYINPNEQFTYEYFAPSGGWYNILTYGS